MRLSKTIVQLMIGAAIIVWLLQLSDATKIVTTMSEIKIIYVVSATLAFTMASTMIALALYVTLEKSKTNTPMKDVILASFGGQLLSDITPARSGYFLTPFVLNKMVGTPIEPSMAGVVATGAVNFFTKAALSIIGLVYFVRILPLEPVIVNALILGISLLTIGGVGLLMLMRGRRILGFVQVLKKLPLIGNLMKKIIDSLIDFQEQALKVSGATKWIVLFVLLSMLIHAAALNFVSNAIGPSSPTFLDFILIVPLISALMYVPVTIAGLGIQEMGYVTLLGLLGVQLEQAVIFALLVRLLFTGTDIIGLYPLLRVGVYSSNHQYE